MTNQKTQVLEYMQKYGSISSFEAYARLGITQLGARIDDLKKDGYMFEKEWIRKRKNGKVKDYIKYKLSEVMASDK